jgi:hypothetical protein
MALNCCFTMPVGKFRKSLRSSIRSIWTKSSFAYEMRRRLLWPFMRRMCIMTSMSRTYLTKSPCNSATSVRWSWILMSSFSTKNSTATTRKQRIRLQLGPSNLEQEKNELASEFQQEIVACISLLYINLIELHLPFDFSN